MKNFSSMKLSAIALLLVTGLNGAQTSCKNSYFQGVAPDITNTKLLPRTQEICFTSFAVMHSGLSRTPLWSAEHLTGVSLNSGHIERANSFHAENSLPASDRAELNDYSRSGFDRGHLSCAADAKTVESENETYTLANMIPQNPSQNRGQWADIEKAVRNIAKQRGEIYVITGPLFMGTELKQLNHRVLIPTNVFKAVFDPSSGKGAAYIISNDSTPGYKTVSIAEMEKISGIVLFPKMSSTAKKTIMVLPEPATSGGIFSSPVPRGVTDKIIGAGQSIVDSNKVSSVKSSYSCGKKTTCSQMGSCEEAKFFLNECHVASLDGNRDGIPCNKLCN